MLLPIGRFLYKLYLRQGEADDYIMNKGTSIASGPLSGVQRSYARKVSPFNLIDPKMKNKDQNYVELYEQTDKKGAEFVDYPTQAGTFYQWG